MVKTQRKLFKAIGLGGLSTFLAFPKKVIGRNRKLPPALVLTDAWGTNLGCDRYIFVKKLGLMQFSYQRNSSCRVRVSVLKISKRSQWCSSQWSVYWS